MQTSYGTAAVGYPGMIADSGIRHVDTRANPNVEIPMGCLVTKGASDVEVILPTVAGDVTGKTKGIALHDPLSAVQYAGEDPKYPLQSAVAVLRQGRVWVKVEEAVADGDDVYARFATGSGGSQKGAFRKSADTATAAQVPTAKYRTSAASGGIAQIEINLP